jgi:GDP-4-dehydro-6-deoxy-D-mannose reductase
MRVLVTGISGFVGQHLARALLAHGHEVAGTCLDECVLLPGAERSVELYKLDLACERDRIDEDLRAAMAAFRPERIVHLAGLAHVGRSWTETAAYERVNVEGTQAVLDAAIDVPVLFTSSAEVYGTVPESEQPIVETRAPAPVSPYGRTKAAGERLVLGCGGVVARPFNLIGPGQAPHFALPTFARQLAAIEAGRQAPVLAVGNLEARRDFVHVADGAEALALLVERGEPGAVYNVARGEAISIREALDLLLAAAGVEVTITVDERFLRPSDTPVLAGSAEPLRRLGWTPRRSTAEAVADLWQWSREQVAAEALRR